jgi:hypothetical protein
VPPPAEALALRGVHPEREQDERRDDHQQDGARKGVKVRGCGGGHPAMVTRARRADTDLSRLLTPAGVVVIERPFDDRSAWA